MANFDYKKLDVYHASIEFVNLADNIVKQLPTGRSYLVNQLRRAALLIPLNIAEGAGDSVKTKKYAFIG